MLYRKAKRITRQDQATRARAIAGTSNKSAAAHGPEPRRCLDADRTLTPAPTLHAAANHRAFGELSVGGPDELRQKSRWPGKPFCREYRAGPSREESAFGCNRSGRGQFQKWNNARGKRGFGHFQDGRQGQRITNIEFARACASEAGKVCSATQVLSKVMRDAPHICSLRA